MLVVLVMSAVPSMATRAWARNDGSHGHPGQSSADQAQMRELLSKLAAASGTPEPEEKTDADLMYEAMLRWNPAPAGSAAVDRLIDSSKKEAAKSKRATQDKVRRMFWKDPFADDPQRLVLVRQEDRDLLDTYQRKTKRSVARDDSSPSLNLTSEVARLRRELAQARADAEEARAEAERAKERAEKRSCVADASVTGEVRKRRHVGSSYRSNPDRSPPQQIALATTAPQVSLPPPAPVTPPPAPIPAHGIIIEPLPSPPPPPPVVETRARRGSRMR
jgi:hypothetical protein